MPSPLEAEIGHLMRDLKNPRAVAEELANRWRLNLFSPEEQDDCAQFMLTAGLYPQLFDQISRLLSGDGRVPWGQFAEAIARSGSRPSESLIKALIKGAESQGALEELLRARQLDLFDKKGLLKEKREELVGLREGKILEKKEDLKERIEFMRANRMIEEEVKLVEQAAELFPEELEIRKQKDSLDIRVAQEIVAKSSHYDDPLRELRRHIESLTPEQEQIKKLITERAKELAQKDQRLAADLAMSLHTMDFHNEAIEILALAPDSPSVDWLRLELMIHARQFVTVLEESTRLETKYANDPEGPFAATYARARALRELGQTEMAIELMESLVRVRPQYKSAQSLLLEWSGGEF